MRTRPLTVSYVKQVNVIRNIQAHRPAAVRNTITMFLYRIVCFFAGIVFMIWGFAIYSNPEVASKATRLITGAASFQESNASSRIAVFASVSFLAAGALCLLVSSLSGKLMRRNRYIIELEDAVHKI
jgi:hypothetical protein